MLSTKRLGRTNVKVTIIGLGGLHLVNIDDLTSDKIIHRALDLGINFLETSHQYAEGKSEQKFGRVLRWRRRECIIHSRCFCETAREMTEAINSSLRNLQTDMIDVYGIHDITRHTTISLEAPLKALKKAQSTGKIRYLAVSGHRQTDLVKVMETKQFDVVMVAVNPLDLDIARAVIPVAKKLDMGIIAMKPFAGGLFTEDPAISLRYVLGRDISVASVGMKTVAEVEKNISIARAFHSLSPGESQELLGKADDLVKKLGKNICRQCGYCVRNPCPQSIDIPRILYLERARARYFAPEWAESQYYSLDVKADACEECGRCEGECPYELPIREMLKEAHLRLSEK